MERNRQRHREPTGTQYPRAGHQKNSNPTQNGHGSSTDNRHPTSVHRRAGNGPNTTPMDIDGNRPPPSLPERLVTRNEENQRRHQESGVDPNPTPMDHRSYSSLQPPAQGTQSFNEEPKDHGLWSYVKEKIGRGNNPKAAVTGVNVGDHGKVNIQHAKFNLEAKILQEKQETRQKDMKCYGLKVFQSKEPTDEYMTDVVLEWTKPQQPSSCKITSYVLILRDHNGEVTRKTVKPDIPSWYKVQDKKLKSGSIYFFCVDTIVTYRNKDFDTFKSDELCFPTRPGKPRDIKVKCYETVAEVQWSPCRGADKFGIELLNAQKHNLDYKATEGSCHKCTFDIDSSRKIRLGDSYEIIVTAYKSEWENSGRQNCFFGNKESPRSVVAKPVEGKNAVYLSWKTPNSSWGLLNSTYEVEVVSEDGKTRKLDMIKKEYTEIDDLKGGMTYYFRVAMVDGHARSLWSTSNSVKTKQCEITVENFRVELSNEDPARSLNCSWDTVDGAIGFKLQYKCPDKSCTVKLGQTDSKHVIKDLDPHTEYSIGIKAEDGHGYGPYCSTVTASTGPDTPTEVRLKVVDKNQIQVSFNKAKNATSHKILLLYENGSERDEKATDRNVVVFTALPFNTKFSATLTAIYGREEGKLACKETILTAPAPPQMKDIRVEIDERNPIAVFWVSILTYENCTNYQALVTCHEDEGERILLEMENKDNAKVASVRYRCLNEGAEFYSKLRMRNEAGYSDWSEKVWITTAPKKVEKLTLEIAGDNLLASWSPVTHTERYKLTLYKEGKELENAEGKRTEITFNEKLSHGFSYHCVITPENASGCGPTTTSDTILAPLDSPTNVEMKELVGQAQFSWTKSKGMRTAEIRFEDSSYQGDPFHVSKDTWCSPPVTYGEVYEFKIWAKNGKARSKQHERIIYCTAPAEVITYRNEINPETSLDVHIDSKHVGPFLLTWKDRRKHKISACITQTNFTIEGLRPATEYLVSACCIYGIDYQRKSERCDGEYVMTLPAMVTGVTCMDKENGLKKLLWKNCGNHNIKYEITWCKDDVYFNPITTFQTFWNFIDLQPGRYVFRVTAGGGKQSKPCCFTVPHAPAAELEVKSESSIIVRSPEVLHANRYSLQIVDEEHDDIEFTPMYSVTPYFWVNFAFECGKKYMAIMRSSCQGHYSAETRRFFFASLLPLEEIKYKLDQTRPTSEVHLEWHKPDGVQRARLELLNSRQEIVAETEVLENKWKFEGLQSNHEYMLKLYPGNAEMVDSICTRITFRTAPNRPEKLYVAKNRQHPQTQMDLTIQADYEGPFLITYERAEGQYNEKETLVTQEKVLSINGLRPGALYTFNVQCQYQSDSDGSNRLTDYATG